MLRAIAALLVLCLFPAQGLCGDRLIMKSAKTQTSPVSAPRKSAGVKSQPEQVLLAENGKTVASQVVRFGRKYVKHFKDLSMVDPDCVCFDYSDHT